MSIQIEFCKINFKDNLSDKNGFGSVNYEYEMSKYLITNSILLEFIRNLKSVLNFFPSFVLYDRRFCFDKKLECKSYDLQRPASFINPQVAKIFCNYLFNKENNFPLEYESCYSLNDNKRKLNYGYFIPNKNEWYKAAYYNGLNYNSYPIKNNLEPLYVQTKEDKVINQGPNTCNFSNAYDYQSYHGFTSRVGECGSASHYGVYDMAGNLYEFIEDNTFFIAGGSWHSFRDVMKNENPFIEYNPRSEFGSTLGLRIVKL